MKFYYLLPLIFLVGCQTVSTTFEEGVNPETYFHRAQTAVDTNDYQTALTIYQKFLDTNPSDPSMVVSAEYEVGFLELKLENSAAAEIWLKKVLARYEDPSQVADLPAWPKVLATKKLLQLNPEKPVGN